MKPTISKIKQLLGPYGSNPDLFLTVLDEAGKIKCANARMIKALHLKDPKKTSTSFFELLHPVNYIDFKSALRHSLENSNPYPIELYLKNGYYHPMKWEVIHFKTEDTKNEEYLCIGKKILENERIVKYNQVLGQNYSLMVEGLSVGVFILDRDGELISVNQKIAEIFNTTLERLYQLSNIKNLWNNFWEIKTEHGSPVSFDETPFMKAMQSGKLQSDVLNVTLRSGQVRSLRFSCQPLFDQNTTHPVSVASTITDITQEILNTRQLEEISERLLLLSRSTSDAIWEWDMQAGQVFRNDALMEMIGYQKEDNKSLSWWLNRIHPEDKERLNEKVKSIVESKLQSWSEEYRFKCADGNYKTIHDRGYVVYENELPIRMIGSLQDVSGLKALENQVVEAKLQHQKAISEAVIQVQEKERHRIGLELHDNVNQLLSTAKLFIESLSSVKEEERMMKAKSIEYILQAIEEIRGLSKELVVPQLNQGGLIESLKCMIDDIHLASEIKAKFIHDCEVELLQADKKLALFRIAQEQIKNILRHSKANTIDIFLRCKEMSVEFIIKDDGVGFDSRKQSNGVGMASISERAKFHNGVSEIISSPGNGCQLTVTIPVR